VWGHTVGTKWGSQAHSWVISRHVGRLLEREGLLERDTEQLDLGKAFDPDNLMPDLAKHSITYRTAGAKYATNATGSVASFRAPDGLACKAK